MISLPIARSLAVLAIGLGSAPLARAQGLGLDLTGGPKGSPPPAVADRPGPLTLGLDLSGKDASDGSSLSVGPPVAATPSFLADGSPDVPGFRLLFAALRERLGERLVAEEKTLKAIAFAPPEARGDAKGIAAALGAELAIAFDVSRGKLWARLYGPAAQGPAAEASIPWPHKLDAARARTLVGRLLVAGKGTLTSAPRAKAVAAEVPPPVPPPLQDPSLPPLDEAAPPAPAPMEAGIDGVDQELARERPLPRVAPVALLLVGPGTVSRSLRASPGPVPQTDGMMFGLGVDARFFPVRLNPRGARGPFSDLSLEGHYRRTLAHAVVKGGADDGVTCGIDDDEVLVRLAYRYPIPGRFLPRVGLSTAFSSERVLEHCRAPALATRSRTVELHLTALEPILGESLQVEVSGGPRFVVSPHAADVPARSFSLEIWLTSHPRWWLYARAGGRYTSTREETVEGVSVDEQRVFAGVELGASL